MAHRLGIIMNGVTGRMGSNQHLARSIVAIRDQGGLTLDGGTVVLPDPVLDFASTSRPVMASGITSSPGRAVAASSGMRPHVCHHGLIANRYPAYVAPMSASSARISLRSIEQNLRGWNRV